MTGSCVSIGNLSMLVITALSLLWLSYTHSLLSLQLKPRLPLPTMHAASRRYSRCGNRLGLGAVTSYKYCLSTAPRHTTSRFSIGSSSDSISVNSAATSAKYGYSGGEVSYPNFSFEVTQSVDGSKARLGRLHTPHGTVETPNFIFCATKAAMKATTMSQLREEGTQFILSNTYHLMLTPGSEIVEKMGGLQKFTGWNGPMLTDSGGYQIFSMGFGSVSNEIKGKRDTEALGWNQTLLSITEDGATFRSYVDGIIHHLTPEKSMEVQRQLGADLIVVLDECTPFNVDKEYTEMSMQRSHRWAIRSLNEFLRTASGKQALYGIVQGGVYDDLRDESTAFINETPFFGIAIGGSLGANKKEMHRIVRYTRERLRNDRPIHLLGIGGIRDIFHGVRQGIDTFDCVHPSRIARHGGALVLAAHWDEEPNPEEPVTPMTLAADRRREKKVEKQRQRELSLRQHFEREKRRNPDFVMPPNDFISTSAVEESTSGILSRKAVLKQKVKEHINVGKARMRNDPRPIDPTCQCYTCKNFSRAYLHHTFKAKESVGGTLVTIHNVHFMNRLMKDIRDAVATDTLEEIEKKYIHPDLSDEED